MTYQQALKKRRTETALARPFVLLGRLASSLFHPKGEHRLFLFAPSADVGGANLNNAEIAGLFRDLKPVVIFSKKPKNNQFRSLFNIPGVVVWDIHKWIDNKLFHFINIFYRGVISHWINTTPDAIVIGGESLYFHKVLPWLKPRIRTIELTHVDRWFDYTQQFVSDIDVRVFSTQHLLQEATRFYEKQGIDQKLSERMMFIDNMVDIPETPVFNRNDQLEVLFIGRGAYQKRVEVIAELAKAAHQRRVPAHISFVGDVSEVINQKSLPFCTFYGNISDRSRLLEIQKKSDALILTSRFEGLPMSVMEMMALGKAIISTAVNAIPDYIKDGVNGYLIPNYDEDKKIVEDALIALSILAHDPVTLREIGQRNHQEAKDKFGEALFARKWRGLVISGKMN